MKKISIVSIAFLIFAMTLPFNVLAEMDSGEKNGSSNPEVTESSKEDTSTQQKGNTSDSKKATTDSKESTEENNTEQEQPNKQNSEESVKNENESQSQDSVDESVDKDKEEQKNEAEQKNKDDSDNSSENQVDDTDVKTENDESTDDAQESKSNDKTAEEKQKAQEERNDEKSINTMSTEADPDIKKSFISKLGHLKSGAVIFEKIGDENPVSSEDYMNQVFFIKKQAESNDSLYYLISTKPSNSEEGAIGWVKSDEIEIRAHSGVDKKPKIFYFKNKENINFYNHAWGGTEDRVNVDINFQNKKFKVNLTEKVGNEIWYRGELSERNVWVSEKQLTTIEEKSVSRLGQIYETDVNIYQELGVPETVIKSGSEHTNHVFFIKKQAKIGSSTYYLISEEPSATSGTIGWVNVEDIQTYSHTGVDRYSKLLKFKYKNNINIYEHAWGGINDLVTADADLQGEDFKVNLTEKVGDNTWYRGTFKGNKKENVWIHESHLTSMEKEGTSRLGQVNDADVNIYEKLGNPNSAIKAGSVHTDKVYFIKLKAEFSGDLYYLISNEASATSGTIGWVNSEDIKTYSHSGVDKEMKTFYFKDKEGINIYNRAWGADKNRVIENGKLQGQRLKVNLTEKVGGNNTWYRGEIDGREGNVWVHESHVASNEVSGTSKLGQIQTSDAKIYTTLGVPSTVTKAGSTYTDKVYFIKKQAEINDKVFYLISNEASATSGTIGWVNSEDIKTYSHSGVDKEMKTFYFKDKEGINIYNKAWGADKNRVIENGKLQGQRLKVNLTEKVGGNNTWYRGEIDGREGNVWVHESHVASNEVSGTNKLGQIQTSDAKIYTTLGVPSTVTKAGSTYTDKVYFIKKQAEINDKTYYLISTEPSSKNGVIGWVAATDMSSHLHEGIDKKDKQFYLTGNGSAYSKAWGGSKDLVIKDLSEHTGAIFNVHLTEKVGSSTWYRGDFEGERIWVRENFVEPSEQDEITNTHYDLTLEEAWEMQSKLNPPPQTDKYRNEPAYVSSNLIEFVGAAVITGDGVNMRSEPHFGDTVEVQVNSGTIVTYLDKVKGDEHVGSTKWYKIEYNNETLYVHSSLANPNGEVATTTDTTNIRQEKGTESHIFDTVPEGTTLNVTQKGGDWHKISYNTWRNAQKNEVIEHMDPTNFLDDSLLRFQFVDLSKTTGATAEELNDYLAGSGLEGHGEAFVKVGNDFGVNELYLISHAIHETGNGASELAQGVKHNGKTVYNMYGVGAIDGCAVECGAATAYNKGWFTPEEAIIGGANFIVNNYIKGENKHGTVQNTLYKMRWNPEAMDRLDEAWHQYATNMGWATNQVGSMYNLYNKLGIKYLNLDVPVYN